MTDPTSRQATAPPASAPAAVPGPAAPAEAKVIAATGGATGGSVLAGLVIYVLNTWVYTPHSGLGDHVPPIVQASVLTLFSALSAWVAGWAAPHSPRLSLTHLEELIGEAKRVAVSARQAAAAVQAVTAAVAAPPEPLFTVHNYPPTTLPIDPQVAPAPPPLAASVPLGGPVEADERPVGTGVTDVAPQSGSGPLSGPAPDPLVPIDPDAPR